MRGHYKAPKLGTKGVMCVEAAWESSLRTRGSVRSMLEMLESVGSCSYLYRSVHTTDGLRQVLSKWLQKQYGHWSVLYLAMHGSNAALHLGPKDAVTLDDLGALLEGKCVDRVIYLGSCATLASRAEMTELQRRTKARYVLGYTRYIDWVTSAASETVLFDALTAYHRVGDALNYVERKDPSSLAASLGFVRYPSGREG